MSKLEGQVTATATNTGTGSIVSLATVGQNGNANIVVINQDINTPVTITPAQSSSWTFAKVMVLADATHSGCADTNVTLGGATIGEGGSWSPTWQYVNNGGSFTIGACGAAVIEIQP